MFPARAPLSADNITATQHLLGVETGENRHAGTQAGFQLALLGTTLAVSLVGGLLTGKWSSLLETTLCGIVSGKGSSFCKHISGWIVNFLPAFNAIRKKSEYFDDKLYWEVGAIPLKGF